MTCEYHADRTLAELATYLDDHGKHSLAKKLWFELFSERSVDVLQVASEVLKKDDEQGMYSAWQVDEEE